MSKSDFERTVQRSTPETGKPIKQRDRKAVLIKLTPEQIKALKQLALDLDCTMQDLVSQEIIKLLKRHNRG